jgi:hypothetical protein
MIMRCSSRSIFLRSMESLVIYRHMSPMRELLKDGVFVAMNTLCSHICVKDNILEPIRFKSNNSNALERLFVAVEMSRLGVEFPDGVERLTRSVSSLTVTKFSKQEISSIITQSILDICIGTARIRWLPSPGIRICHLMSL